MDPHQEHSHKWYTFGCKDATLLMTKKQFSRLTFSEKILVAFHLLICKYCRRFKTQVSSFADYFRKSADKNTFQLPLEKKEALNQIITDNLK